jgi:hypothetical protein
MLSTYFLGYFSLLITYKDVKIKKTCRICNYIAKNENALNNHMQKEHGLIKDCKLKNCKIISNHYLYRSPYQF